MKTPPVWCNFCGKRYEDDPARKVECPTCHAKPGQACMRPSEHKGPFVDIHATRDIQALRDAPDGYGQCCDQMREHTRRLLEKKDRAGAVEQLALPL